MPAEAPSLGRLDLQRLLFRCAGDFVLDEFSRLERRFGGSIVQGVVALAVRQAWRRSPDRLPTAGGIGLSLGIAAETVRRHFLELKSDGWLSADLTATDRSLSQISAFALESRSALAETVARLQRLGYPPLAGASLLSITSQSPIRIENAIEDLMLRVAEMSTPVHGSIQDAQVITALLLMNADEISDHARHAWTYATTDAAPPDRMMRSVTASEIAHRLSKPYSTTHRRLEKLVALGRARREGGGYTADRVFQESEPVRLVGWALNQDFEKLVLTSQRPV